MKFPITPASTPTSISTSAERKRFSIDNRIAIKQFDRASEMAKELSVLKFLAKAPNVVRLRGSVVETGKFWLLLSLAPTSLCAEIHSGRMQSQVHAMEVLRDVANALTFMHRRSLGHFDLKSPNVLLEIRNSGWRALLCDFGHTALVPFEMSDSKPRIGTFGWTAPETLRVDDARISVQADVWSWGVLAWEISVRQIPWSGFKSALIIAAVGYGGCSPDKHRGISMPTTTRSQADFARLVQQCFNFKPTMRPRMQELLREAEMLITRFKKETVSDISTFLCGG
jgi:serine/threonine protein kinase